MTKSMQQKYLQAVVFLISCSPALLCHGTLKTSGITDDEKKIILQEHNRLRQLVATGEFPGQPAAENMQEIVWDNELADRAQQWANNCEFRHDPSRTIKRFTMGQNLAIIWSTAPLEQDDGDFPSRIKNWFNEVQKYSFGASWSPKTGHYSQLVWGETNLIGCGFSEYKDKAKYNKLYVCNYGPGGNVVGYNPYEVGKPSCKNYGMDPSPRYKGLCMDHTLSPSNISKKVSTYEQKQNSFNSKAGQKSSLLNNQQLPKQAEIQIQLANKQPNALQVPVLISTLFKQQLNQAKTETTNAQRQQETKYNLPHTQSLHNQQPYSRTNVSPNTPATPSSGQEQQEEKQNHFVSQKWPQHQLQVQQEPQTKTQHQPKPELQIQSLPNEQTKTQPQQESQSELQPKSEPQTEEVQETQPQQQHQVEIITLDTSPNTDVSKSSTKTGWSYFTSRDSV